MSTDFCQKITLIILCNVNTEWKTVEKVENTGFFSYKRNTYITFMAVQSVYYLQEMVS